MKIQQTENDYSFAITAAWYLINRSKYIYLKFCFKQLHGTGFDFRMWWPISQKKNSFLYETRNLIFMFKESLQRTLSFWTSYFRCFYSQTILLALVSTLFSLSLYVVFCKWTFSWRFIGSSYAKCSCYYIHCISNFLLKPFKY